jgi:hypothetical protein
MTVKNSLAGRCSRIHAHVETCNSTIIFQNPFSANLKQAVGIPFFAFGQLKVIHRMSFWNDQQMTIGDGNLVFGYKNTSEFL